MNRRLFLAAMGSAAATALAQEKANGLGTEEALKKRVAEFYDLLVAKKYRQAEALVAEESQDEYYTGHKQDIRGYVLKTVEIAPDGLSAKANLISKNMVLIMGAVQVFDFPSISQWKFEKGEWKFYIDPDAKFMTPFGRMKPGDNPPDGKLPGMEGQAPELIEMQRQVTADKNVVELNGTSATGKVTITNRSPGPVDLKIDPQALAGGGLKAEFDRIHLEAGQKAVLTLTNTALAGSVRILAVTVSPFGAVIEIRVVLNRG